MNPEAADGFLVNNIEQLERLYDTAPVAAATIKEVGHLHPVYRAWIAAAPFVALATSGPGGLDVSPRGDAPPVAVVEDDSTLLIPDRRGNNRIDSLRNLVTDPRVALLFLIPGVKEALRINGRAAISIEPALLERFAVDGKPPRTVLKVKVETVFFQCGRAAMRSGLWAGRAAPTGIPSPGEILSALGQGRFDGEAYDRALPQRQAATLY